jgi:hypothetical protein
VKVHVEERCACNIDTALQRRLDVLQVIETLGAKQVDDEVRSRKPHAITINKEVLTVLMLRDVRGFVSIFLLGGA